MRTLSRFRIALVALAVAFVPMLALADGGDDGDANEVEFKGIVTAKPADGLVGDWTIGARKVTTTATTKFDTEHGMPVVGATVEVEGTQATKDDPIVALKIEVKSASAGPGIPGGDDDEETNDDDGEITGKIDALPAGDTFLGTWTVAGKPVIVLSTTRLDQEHGAFALGTMVEVEGTPGPDGLVASRIESKGGMGMPEPEDDALEIEGLIEALPADGLIGTWTVAGKSIVVDAQTKLETDGGPFAVGVAVEVKGVPLDGGAIRATKIETEDGNGAPMPALEFFGAIEAMPPAGTIGVWTIAGKTVNVTASTELDDEAGPFVVGASVKVHGWPQLDGAIEAREIETVGAAGVDAATSKVAVEFFNASLGHFFVTASPEEIAALDAGAFNGAWTRTGQAIKTGGSVGVCRFYGMPPKGPDSHFLTVDAAECGKVMRDYAAWTFEKHAFATTPPVGGACAAGLLPVHRFYNNPTATAKMNHRYVVSPAIAAEMIAQGWLDEGVVMCARP
jgi:hypothetical protein